MESPLTSLWIIPRLWLKVSAVRTGLQTVATRRSSHLKYTRCLLPGYLMTGCVKIKCPSLVAVGDKSVFDTRITFTYNGHNLLHNKCATSFSGYCEIVYILNRKITICWLHDYPINVLRELRQPDHRVRLWCEFFYISVKDLIKWQ